MEEERKTDESRQKIKSEQAGGFDEGFTLLELLISITLLVIIIVLMMGAVRMGSRSVAAGEKKMEVEERFRSVVSIIDAQIQSQVPLTYVEEGSRKYYFRGDVKTLRFATNYSIWGAGRGYVIVDYRVEADNSGKEIIIVAESTPGARDHRDVRLIEASSISFEYFRKDASEEQGKWVTSLTEADIIPEKIRLHLTQGRKKLSLLFPVRVGGKITGVQGGTAIAPNTPKGIPPQAK
jgi:general secretion pathway protein J